MGAGLVLLVVVLVVFAIYDKVLGLSTMTGGASTRVRASGRESLSRRAGDAVLTVLANVSDAMFALLPKRLRRSVSGTGQSRTLWWIVLGVLAFLSAPAFLMIPLSFDSGSGLTRSPVR
ncbi:hypothetical protein G6F31_017505 [Rhizopus arrhizus]|nr:hypothetical protein G6F31_017505 [Rhizopus arrhizus]